MANRTETITSAALAAPVTQDAAPVDPMARRSDETPEAYISRLQSAISATKTAVTADKLASGELGENVKGKLAGHVLTLTIDLSHRAGKSSTGKSDIIATTSGNMDLGNGVRLGVNCFRKV